MSRVVPPVSGLKDRAGRLIELDQDCIVTWYREGARARIVAIGDEGLPGVPVLRVRPHGGTYISGARPEHVEVVTFDEYKWLAAETAAAQEMVDPSYRYGRWEHFQRSGADLARCVFGGFWFEQFQRAALRHYLARQLQAAA